MVKIGIRRMKPDTVTMTGGKREGVLGVGALTVNYNSSLDSILLSDLSEAILGFNATTYG